MLFRDILLVDEHYKAVPHANILVEDGRIRSITTDPVQDYKGEIYDGRGKIASPGFFNIHCHVPMVLLRGYGEGLPLQSWLFDKMFPFEALLSDEDVYWGAMLGIAEMIASGCASFTDMYFSMPMVARAVEESGIKANLSHGTSANGDDCAFTESTGYAGTKALMEIARGASHGRIIADASIHAEYTSGPRLCREVAEFAQQNNMRIHLHLSETKKEHDEAKVRRGMTAAKWFESLGMFKVPVTAAHCVWVEEEDIRLLAKYDVTVSHNPSSNLKLGSGIAPLPFLREAGVRVGIGTDGAASNNNLNVHEEVYLAAIVQKGVWRDPLFLSMTDIFEMACRNGALSQGRQDCGAIKEGNRADIVVYDADAPHMLPLIDPISNLLYSANSRDILLNMVDGKVLYRDGAFTTIDIEKIKHNATRIAEEKLRQLGS